MGFVPGTLSANPQRDPRCASSVSLKGLSDTKHSPSSLALNQDIPLPCWSQSHIHRSQMASLPLLGARPTGDGEATGWGAQRGAWNRASLHHVPATALRPRESSGSCEGSLVTAWRGTVLRPAYGVRRGNQKTREGRMTEPRVPAEAVTAWTGRNVD